MKIITINLPEHFISAIQTLTDLQIYPSRSEAIRIALGDFLDKEIQFDKELLPDNFEKTIRRLNNH
jgi:Arc/MetJ-type ribon-helix-helix transcriptional regulator